MLTLFGKDINKLSFEELKRERSAQAHIRAKVKSWLVVEKYNNEKYSLTEEQRIEERKKVQDDYDNGRITQYQWLGRLSAIEQRCTNRRYDRVVLLEIYLKNLNALIADLDFYIERRAEPITKASRHNTKTSIRARNAKARKNAINDNAKVYQWKQYIDRDSFCASWDREKFLLIARDRGYQTESAIIQAVGDAINLDRARSRLVIENGRFTWGQVLCLGAMLQMTPKEFCDTFLSDYFTESFGEYRADYDNINQEELLHTPIRPMGSE